MDGGVCEHCGRGAAAAAGAGAGAGAGARAAGAAAAKARPRKAPEGGRAAPRVRAKAEGGAEQAPPKPAAKPPPRRTQSQEPARYEQDGMAALARLLAKHKDQQVVARKEHLRKLLRV